MWLLDSDYNQIRKPRRIYIQALLNKWPRPVHTKNISSDTRKILDQKANMRVQKGSNELQTQTQGLQR